MGLEGHVNYKSQSLTDKSAHCQGQTMEAFLAYTVPKEHIHKYI